MDAQKGSFSKDWEINDSFRELCTNVGLEDWIKDEHIKETDVYKIRANHLDPYREITRETLISEFFSRITANDYRSVMIFKELFKKPTTKRVIKEGEDFFSSINLEEASTTGSNDNGVSCRDAMFAILHCCDLLLRQKLICKISSCHLAVPLILPSPSQSGELLFLLWELSALKKTWKTEEQYITSYKLSTVAFVRYGKTLLSKSHILNKVLGKFRGDVSYPFFSESRGDSCPSVWSNGTLEVVWQHTNHIQGDSSTESNTEQMTCFLNLRGTLNESKTTNQEQFVYKFASCIVVFIDKSSFTKFKAKLDELSKAKVLVVVITDLDKSYQDEAELQIVESEKDKCLILYAIGCSESNIANELVNRINSIVATMPFPQALNDLGASLCKEMGIKNTFMDISITKANGVAKIICKPDQEKTTTGSYKQEVFPLDIHWKEKSRKIRKLTYSTAKQDLTQEDKGGNTKMQNLDQQSVAKISNEMEEFIQSLMTFDHGQKMIMIKCINTYFDVMTLRTKKELLAQHATDKLKQLKNNDDSTTLNKLIKNVLGVENLIRELGQIYEIYSQQNPGLTHLSVNIDTLAEQVAELFVAGLPLEIVDGEARNIPLKWIKRVIGKVYDKVGNCRVFTISVIGIQSSGKSTLLNSLFGVSFKVSSGRCTRGMSLQMIEIDDSIKQDLNCDYLMIIDSEGLGAAENYSEAGHSFDNEMATFSACFSDLTLLNIQQEFIGRELNDILQICVFAFMRMDEANLKHFCRVIQQKASDQTTSQNNITSDQIILNELDSAVKIAAQMEGKSDKYRKFSDILEIEEGTEDSYKVTCLPVLQANSRSPPNEEYSEGIKSLRSNLLNFIGRQTSVRTTLLGFSSKLEIIWKAIIREKFVFNFKNALETLQYNTLVTRCLQWKSDCMTKLMKKVVVAEECLRSCSKDDIDDKFNKKMEEIKTFGVSEGKKIKTNISACIEDPEFSLMKTHENTFITDIDSFIMKKHMQIQKDLTIFSKLMKQKCEDESDVLPKIRNEMETELELTAANFLRNISPSVPLESKSKTIEEKFDALWEEKLENISGDFNRPHRDMKNDINVIKETRQAVLKSLRDACENTNLSQFVEDVLVDGGKDLSSFTKSLPIMKPLDIDDLISHFTNHEAFQGMHSVLNKLRQHFLTKTALEKDSEKETDDSIEQSQESCNLPRVIQCNHYQQDTHLLRFDQTTKLVLIHPHASVKSSCVFKFKHDSECEGDITNPSYPTSGLCEVHLAEVDITGILKDEKLMELLVEIVQKGRRAMFIDIYYTFVSLFSWVIYAFWEKLTACYLSQIVTSKECCRVVFGHNLISKEDIKKKIKEKVTTRFEPSLSQKEKAKPKLDKTQVISFLKASLLDVRLRDSDLIDGCDSTILRFVENVERLLEENDLRQDSGLRDHVWDNIYHKFIEIIYVSYVQLLQQRWIDIIQDHEKNDVWSVGKMRGLLLNMLKQRSPNSSKFLEKFATEERVLHKRFSTLPWYTKEIKYLDTGLLSYLNDMNTERAELILEKLSKFKLKFLLHLKKEMRLEHFYFQTAINALMNELTSLGLIESREIAVTLIHMCAWLEPLIIKANIKYQSEHDVYNVIKNEKDKMFELFESRINTGYNEKQQAKDLFSAFIPFFKNNLGSLVAIRLLEKVKSLAEFKSKSSFDKAILTYLCKEGTALSYLMYFHDPFTLYKEWVLHFITEKCSEGQINLQTLVDETVKAILDIILDTLENSDTGIDVWDETASKNLISSFEELLKHIDDVSYDEQAMNKTKQKINIKDFNLFKKEFRMVLDTAHSFAFSELSMVNTLYIDRINVWLEELPRSISDEIALQYIGCEKQCPFCKAKCDQTVAHEMHSAEYHLPNGLIGRKSHESNSLLTQECTSQVASDSYYGTNLNSLRPIKEYQKEFKDWNIKEDKTGEANIYWSWVMKTHHEQLAKAYGSSGADIPNKWNEITQTEALNFIEEVFASDE